MPPTSKSAIALVLSTSALPRSRTVLKLALSSAIDDMCRQAPLLGGLRGGGGGGGAGTALDKHAQIGTGCSVRCCST